MRSTFLRLAAAAALAAAALASGGCDPSTTRPALVPYPEADTAGLALLVPEATRRLAEALREDSVPVSHAYPRDGYLRTEWIDLRTGRPASPTATGDSVVRVRGWIEPTIPNHSRATVETVIRPIYDPSLPERELERPAPAGHPMVRRVREVLAKLGEH